MVRGGTLALVTLLCAIVTSQGYELRPTNSGYTKVVGALQYGDVANFKCENNKYLTDTGTCIASNVGSTDSEDFGLVNPTKGEDNHDPILSGDVVSIRAADMGKFLSFPSWDDNLPFEWTDEATSAAQFRIVLLSEVFNAEKSTSEGSYTPSGESIPYDAKVVLFPQGKIVKGDKVSKNVGKYSLYAQEGGTMYLTDSVYLGWTLSLSDHNECYKENDEAEGAMCCNWQDVNTPNEGVANTEQRLCCRRSGHQLCHATAQRIKACSVGYTPDEEMGSVHSSLHRAEAAEADALDVQSTAAAAQVGMDQALEDRQTAEAHQASLQKAGVDTTSAAAAAQTALGVYTTAAQVYHDANEVASTRRAEADNLMTAYKQGATGGKCCQWNAPSGDVNPKLLERTCCTADKCSVTARTTAHKECSWQGQLTDQGCVCHGIFGGIDCRVETTTSCFSGVRGNGDPSPNSACATCYKCQEGSAKIVDGEVVVAGDDRCKALVGPEELCLSCDASSGLISIGDKAPELWTVGYRALGVCKPFPSGMDITSLEPRCESNCFPRGLTAYQTGKIQVCTVVCSIWNPVKVQQASVTVDAAGLCHVSKESYCLASPESQLNNLEGTGRQCYTKKKVVPRLICYVMGQTVDGSTNHLNGYGAGCSDMALPADEVGLTGSDAAKWCCWTVTGTSFKPPSWLKNIDNKQWCSGAALLA